MERTIETKKRYLAMKGWLKEAAIDIRQGKLELKVRLRTGEGPDHVSDKYKYSVYSLSYHYRHKHIAYSELRGRTRESIERPGEFNQPNESLIEKYKKEVMEG